MIYIPKGYKSSLNLIETQKSIKMIKDFFQLDLAKRLNLIRVTAPMFVVRNSGMNDDLNGVEKAVSFEFSDDDGQIENAEVVHSLAKWKRYALKKYEFSPGSGLYTDMNAIRASEEFDNTHSIYVDQWDWEKVIEKKDLNYAYLQSVVEKIYKSFIDLDLYLRDNFKEYKRLLPENIFFVTSQELEDAFPSLSPEEREKIISRDKGAVFISQIGKKLKSGKRHSMRSPDYDDWNLNGDIIFWNPILENSLELSSMGVRVSPEVLKRQLEESHNLDRLNYNFHSLLINGELPYTIGGGIGQSRICMFFMQKAHIGEVQSSIWPKSVIKTCKDNGIILL